MKVRASVATGLAATAVVLASSHSARTEQQPVFRVNTDMVRVDVLVTDGGRPVAGLTAADFELKDNDVRQDIELAAVAGSVKVVFVLDVSGSVSGRRLEYLKRATQSAVAKLRPQDAACLVTFNHQAALRMEGSGDRVAIDRALGRAVAGGRTALWDALYSGLSLVAEDTSRSLLVLFSDGADNASFLSRDAVMASLRRSMATVYVVGVRGSEMTLSGRALQDVADHGGGNLLWADNDSHLPDMFTRAFDEFRARYLLTYSPTGVRRDDGWHKIAVTLKGKSGKVKVRPGYFAAAPSSAASRRQAPRHERPPQP